jgi:hypothetical protein
MPPNKAVNTDAQVRPRAQRASILVRRLPLRYASAESVPAPAKFAVLQAGLMLQTP